MNRPDAPSLKITIHKANLSDSKACLDLCEGVKKKHGRGVDILVSNAGYGKRIPDIWLVPFRSLGNTCIGQSC